MSKKKIGGWLFAFALLVVSFFPSNTSVNAANTETNVTATCAYNIIGLPENRVVQNFHVATNYVYITQHKNNSTILSRCTIEGTNARYKDSMILENFGHGETLDVYDYTNTSTNQTKTYCLVGCMPDDGDSGYALRLCRIQYSAGTTLTTYENSSVSPNFTHLNFANKTGSRIGTLQRVVGVYTSADKFVFRVQTKNVDTGKPEAVTYSVYDGAKLNAALDNGHVDLSTAAIAKYCESSFTQTESNIVWAYKNTLQGMEVRQNGSIYVAANTNAAALPTSYPKISWMDKNGNLLKTFVISNPEVKGSEIEGLQVKGTDLYFVIPDPNRAIYGDNVDKQNGQKIYKIYFE